MAIAAGNYTADEINAFGLNNNETIQVQYVDGVGYKLSNNEKGGRYLEVVGGGNVGGGVPSSYQGGASQAGMQPYLDKYNQALIDEQNASNSIFKSPEKLKAEFDKYTTPDMAKPEVPYLVDLYGKLRSDNNLTELEKALADLKQQEGMIEASLQQYTMDQEGRSAAMNIIEGRIGEGYRRAQIELQFLGTRKGRLVDELQGRYSVINTIINLTGQDYQMAKQAYDDEFSRNLEMYKIIRGTQEKQLEYARQDRMRVEDRMYEHEKYLLEVERQDRIRAEDSARSNLQIYANLIKSGNMSFDQLAPETRAQIAKFEAQSGLGTGFLSSLRQDNAEGDIKSITTRQDASGMKYADIIMKMPDGSLRIEPLALGSERLPANATSTAKINEEAIIERIVADYIDKGSEQGAAMRKSMTPEALVRKIRSEYELGAKYLNAKSIDAAYLRDMLR